MTRSSVAPSTNSPGWRMNASSSRGLDELGQIGHRLLHVDEAVARVAEDAEAPVAAHVDRRGLDQIGLERVEPDPARRRSPRGCSCRSGPWTAILRRPCILSSVHSSCSPIRGDTRGCRSSSSTEIPGPRSRALTARKDAHHRPRQGPVDADVDRPRPRRAAARRRRQHLHRLRRRHRLPEHRPRAPARREGRAGRRPRKFLHTDFTIVPYESYVALAERLLPLVPITRRASARRSSTPAPRRSRTRSRSRRPPPAGPR